MTPKRARIVALIVAGTFFMEFLDGTVIATALPAMAHDFGRPAVQLSIGISAYLLTLAVFIPLSGWVADRYGTRDVFLGAIITFTAASMLCGLCTGLWPFVGARVLQGMGGAMMVPVGRLTVLRTTEKSALVGAIALLLPQIGHQRRPFDMPGFLLSGFSLALIMEGLELVSGEGPSWAAPVLLVAGVGLGVVAVRHGLRARAPMLDLSPLRIQTFLATVTGGMVFRTTIGTIPFLLPLLFQIGFGLDAFRSGMLVLSTFLGNVGMKPFTTAIMRRWGFRTTGIATGVLASVCLGLCAVLYPATPVPLLVVVLFAGGLTRSMQFTVLNTLAFVDVPHGRMSGASSLSSVAQQMSIGMGVALGAACLHLVAMRHGGPPSLADFHLVFFLVAVMMLAGLPSFFRLPAGAGSEVSGHRPA